MFLSSRVSNVCVMLLRYTFLSLIYIGKTVSLFKTNNYVQSHSSLLADCCELALAAALATADTPFAEFLMIVSGNEEEEEVVSVASITLSISSLTFSKTDDANFSPNFNALGAYVGAFSRRAFHIAATSSALIPSMSVANGSFVSSDRIAFPSSPGVGGFIDGNLVSKV